MFIDRADAGRQLAEALKPLAPLNPLVLALPRGGVPIGRIIATALNAPLDVLIVRKLGAPGNPEFAFGALGEGGVQVLDTASMNAWGIDASQRDRTIANENHEIQRRVNLYRNGRPVRTLENRTVIIVDDGLATGATAEAAVQVARTLGANHIALAVPTSSREAYERLSTLCDDFVCLEIPEWFGSVGAQYVNFPQVSDAEVVASLDT